MTTKYKIITGFILMVLLMMVIAVAGYFSLNRASGNFVIFDRLQKSNVFLSDMLTDLYATMYDMDHYLFTLESAVMEKARTRISSGVRKGEDAIAQMDDPNHIKQVQTAVEDFKAYGVLLEKVYAGVQENNRAYNQIFLPAVSAMQVQINNLNRMGIEISNMAAIDALNSIEEATAALRISAARVSLGMKEADIASLDGHRTKSAEAVKRLGETLQTGGGRASFASLQSAFTDLDKAAAEMLRKSRETMTAIEQTYVLDNQITKVGNDINKAINDRAEVSSTETLHDNGQAQTTLVLLSIAGLIIGAICAAFILFGLIRVLNRVSAYATAVAQGRFNHVHDIREKGEIGNMVAALEAIPAIFHKLSAQCAQAAGHIKSGRFNARLREDDFEGGFKELTGSVNTVAASFTSVIDSLPVGVFTADSQCSVQYMNENAKTVVGGKLAGNMASMDATRPQQGEATTTVDGQRKTFLFSTMPMYDLNGKAVGFMQIVNDTTQIKEQQTLMLQVAGNAMEISGRVAAAAEELAAQVEQVSRGAEMQRGRVESTASAMTEMNATVLEVAHNASQASEQSESARKNADSGAKLVEKVVQSINGVNQVAMRLQENMEGLGKQAQSIGGVMNVISDIADQTNLLALNAAIEAARAGEAGRGFAVVADEVRKLAEKTMSATHEVGSNIEAIQESASLNIREVGNAVTSILEATELANASGEALQQIVNLVTTTTQVITSIATAAEEQSATSEEISKAITEINNIVGQTTDGMVQSSAAVHDLSRTAAELNVVMEKLK